eukprot:11392307-Ditylum_brightwellii.AAC.1
MSSRVRMQASQSKSCSMFACPRRLLDATVMERLSRRGWDSTGRSALAAWGSMIWASQSWRRRVRALDTA